MNGDDRQNNTPRSASSPRKVVSSEKCPGRQMAVVVWFILSLLEVELEVGGSR